MEEWRERLHGLHPSNHHVFALRSEAFRDHFRTNVGYACFSSAATNVIVFRDDGSERVHSMRIGDDALPRFLASCRDDEITDVDCELVDDGKSLRVSFGGAAGRTVFGLMSMHPSA